jgi:hypothetical protein
VQFDKKNKQLSPPYKKSAPAPTSTKDITEIKRIATDYLIALQERKPELMKEVMYKELSKHTVANYGDGGHYIRATNMMIC